MLHGLIKEWEHRAEQHDHGEANKGDVIDDECPFSAKGSINPDRCSHAIPPPSNETKTNNDRDGKRPNEDWAQRAR